MNFVCSTCGIGIDASDPEPRCPRCLRKNTVVSREAAAAAQADRALAELWPMGDRCPLCGEREVGEDVFYLRASKGATSVDGTRGRWVSASARCCSPCHSEVRKLDTWRRLGMAIMMLGVASPFIYAWLTGQMDRTLSSTSALLVALVWVASIALPTMLFRRQHNHVRGLLDQVWIVDVLRDQLEMPRGVPIYDLVNVHARLPDADEAVDLGRLAERD